MDQQLNPYAAPSEVLSQPLEPNRLETGRVRFWFAQIFASILVAGSVPASALAMWDIESIVGSGLVFLPMAIALVFLAMPRVLRWLIPIAITMLMIVGGIVFAINVNHWSPTDAQQPIGFATIACAVGMQLGWLPIALVTLRFKRMAAAVVSS